MCVWGGGVLHKKALQVIPVGLLSIVASLHFQILSIVILSIVANSLKHTKYLRADGLIHYNTINRHNILNTEDVLMLQMEKFLVFATKY